MGWSSPAHQQFFPFIGPGVHDSILMIVPPTPCKLFHLSFSILQGTYWASFDYLSFKIGGDAPIEVETSEQTHAIGDENQVDDIDDSQKQEGDDRFHNTYGPGSIPFVGRTSDAGLFVPHVSIPPNNSMLPMTFIFGSSISIFGSSAVRLKTYNPFFSGLLGFGDEEQGMACCIPPLPISLNLACNDPPPIPFSFPLPLDVVISPCSVEVGVTLADVWSALIDWGVEILMEGVGEGLGALAGKGVKKVKMWRKGGAELASEIVEDAGQEAAAKVLKDAGVTRLMRKSTRQATEEAAEKAAKEAADKAAKEAADKAAKEAADEAAKEAAQKAGKEAGGEAGGEAGERGAKQAADPDQALKQADEANQAAKADLETAEGDFAKAQRESASRKGKLDEAKKQAELAGDPQDAATKATQADDAAKAAREQADAAKKRADDLRDAAKEARANRDAAQDPLQKGEYAKDHDMLADKANRERKAAKELEAKAKQAEQAAEKAKQAKEAAEKAKQQLDEAQDALDKAVRDEAAAKRRVGELEGKAKQTQAELDEARGARGEHEVKGILEEAVEEHQSSGFLRQLLPADAGDFFGKIGRHFPVTTGLDILMEGYDIDPGDDWAPTSGNEAEHPEVTLSSPDITRVGDEFVTDESVIRVVATFSKKVQGFGVRDVRTEPPNLAGRDPAAGSSGVVPFVGAAPGVGQLYLFIQGGEGLWDQNEPDHQKDCYSFQVTPCVDPGEYFTVDIDAARVEHVDSHGLRYPNKAADQLRVRFENRGPVVVLTSSESEATNRSPIPMTAHFNLDVTGFEANDIVVENGRVQGFQALSAHEYAFEVAPASEGRVAVSVPAEVAKGPYGYDNLESAVFAIDYDTTEPKAASRAPIQGTTARARVPVTTEFDKPVPKFGPKQIRLENAKLADFTEVEKGRVYRYTLVPEADGPVTATIPDGAVPDVAGNLNRESVTSFVYDSSSPEQLLGSDFPNLGPEDVGRIQKGLQIMEAL